MNPLNVRWRSDSFAPPSPERLDRELVRAWKRRRRGHAMLGMVAVIGSLAGSLAFAADPPPAPGSLDRSFLPAVTGLPLALTLQPDGRLLVGGPGSLARYEVSGAPDPSFNPTVGTFDFIQTIALRADGTMLLGGGGLFSSLSQIVALNPNGQPMAEIPPAFDGDVHQILVQADDGILVAGGFTYAAEKLTDVRGRIARLEPVEGHLDTGFDPGLGADGTIFALALDDQGRILAGGAFTNFDRVPMAGIARLSPQGRLDPGFTPRLNDGDVQDIAVQSDGRILIVGNFTRIEDQPAGGLARLLPDGRLDTSFHPVVEFTRIAPELNELKGWALAITAENRILVGGPFTQVNGESRSYLAELNPAGELVPAFTGRLDGIPWLFALRPNGRIVIGGNFDTVEGANRPYVAQLFGHSDENLSPTIVHQPEDQAVPVGATAVFRVLAEGSAPLEYQWWFQNTNSIPGATNSVLVLANVQSTNLGTYKVTVRNPHGTAESRDATLSFANLAVITRQPHDATLLVGEYLPLDLEYSGPEPDAWQWYRNAMPIPDGTNDAFRDYSITEAGSGNYWVRLHYGTGDLVSEIARVEVLPRPLYPWSLDPSFRSQSSFTGTVSAQALLPGGKVVIGGTFTNIQGLARRNLALLNADGTIDPALDPGELFNTGVRAITVQTDQKFLVIGTYTNTTDRLMRSTVLRFQADGSLDTSFDLPVEDPTNMTFKAVAHHPDNHILVGGSFYTLGLFRFSKFAWLGMDGFPEPQLTPGTNSTGPTYGVGTRSLDWITMLPDRKVLIGGSFEGVSDILTVTNLTRTAVARFNANGTVDQSFNLGDTASATMSQAVCLADGSYLLFGGFTQLNGVAVTNLARILPDGSVDPAFRLPAATDRIESVLGLQADGRLLVRGTFTLEPGRARNGFARLNPDLTLEWNFIPDAAISAIGMLQPDGRILMAGSYNSTSSGLRVLAGGPFRLMGGRGDSPVIEQDPQSIDVAVGADAELKVIARGTSELRYLWRRSPYSLYRQTQPTLALHQVRTADAGTYYVTVYNDYGIVDSRPATLNVVEVTVLPKKVTARVGYSVTFQGSVWSLNQATLSWQKDGVTIDGATNLDLSLSNVRTNHQGRYTLTAEINGSRFTSPPAELIVTTPPAIVTQPTSQTVRVGSRAVLTVEATGTPPLTYWWRHDNHYHPSQETPALILNDVRSGDAGNYYVEVVNLQGSVLSDTVRLEVIPAPNFLPGTGGIEIRNGVLTLRLQDYDPAKPIEILASSDLKTWTVIQTIVQSSGVVEYSEPIPPAGGYRYYQARQ